MFHVPEYTDWYFRQDLGPVYAFWARQLSLVDGPDVRWITKSPLHAPGYTALLTAVPTAGLVDVRRDVVGFFTSFLNLAETARSIFSDDVDARELGREWLRIWRRVADRVDSARVRPAISLDYSRLVDAPYSCVSEVCETLAVAAPGRAAVERETARLKALHVYDARRLEYYGIDARTVRDNLGDSALWMA